MTAAEIRKAFSSSTNLQCCILAEVAAQLAELNQSLRDIHPELHMPEECRKHQCEFFTSYLAHGERSDDMSHEAYHEVAKSAAAHFKSCHTVSGVCKTCERYEQMLRA